VSVAVLAPGLFTTVQDLGRPGYQAFGVPVSGAMDPAALRVANLLVGNDEGAAALEITLAGPTLRLQGDCLLALAGAELPASSGGTAIPALRAFRLPAGADLTCGSMPRGCRAYLAFAGGLAVPGVLGSRSTYTRARLGGVSGRALRAGDVLPTGEAGTLSRRIAATLHRPGAGVQIARVGPVTRATSPGGSPPVVRLIPGAHQPSLAAESLARLWAEPFRVSGRSDRMAYRLEGAGLKLEHPVEVLSEGVAWGTMQLPPDGDPLILMADRQTTGGYPRIAEAAAVDLPLLAQLRPGDLVRFRPCSVAEAQSLLAAAERELRQLASALRILHR
jgi:antagonist of KipI